MRAIFHEAPLSLFDQVQKVTSGDYALVHLFEKGDEYYAKFQAAVDSGREVILDNSIFELGTAFDMDKFASWIKILQPSWYVIPDTLEGYKETTVQLHRWLDRYDYLPGKKIGVVQGKNLSELISSYIEMEPLVDKVAISFDYSTYRELYPEDSSIWRSYSRGRYSFITLLEKEGIINKNKPHHLLGCSLPQEVIRYEHLPYIDSIDTSNPVLHGIHGIRYTSSGLEGKHTLKMADVMFEDHRDKWGDVLWNIEMFKRFASGSHSSLTPEKR